MTALLHRAASGRGQHVDVSMHAAMNVTTEAATYEWLVAGRTVQRQTARHAAVQPTMASSVTGADGRDVTSGFPPRSPQEFRTVLDWLDELGLRDEFDDSVLLEIGAQGSGIHLSDIGSDAEATAIYGAGRESLKFIATRLPAYQFFVGAQERGLSCGVVFAPEEVMEDPHFVERGFPVKVFHEALGRDVVYPGAPFIAHGSPWKLRGHAPRLGEHNAAGARTQRTRTRPPNRLTGQYRAGSASGRAHRPRHDRDRHHAPDRQQVVPVDLVRGDLVLRHGRGAAPRTRCDPSSRARDAPRQ